MRIFIACLSLILSVNVFSQTELINNGNFESNTFSGNVTLCVDSNLTNWTVVTNKIDGIHDSWAVGNNWPDGTGWYIDLVGSCSSVSSLAIIRSNSFDIDSNHTYDFSFIYGSQLDSVKANATLKSSSGNILQTWQVSSNSVNMWFNFSVNYRPNDIYSNSYLEFEGLLPSFQTGGVAIDSVSFIERPLTVGINEDAFSDNFLVYPNPTSGDFIVNMESINEPVTVQLRDLTGRLIMSKMYNNNQLININISEPNGVYLLIIEGEDKRTVSRIVKI